MDGKQILKKSKKIPTKIKVGYNKHFGNYCSNIFN